MLPARTLRPGGWDVQVGAAYAGTVAPSGAQPVSASRPLEGRSESFARLFVRDGVLPVAAVRVGIPAGEFNAQVQGSALRLGLRRDVLGRYPWAVSVGGGVRGFAVPGGSLQGLDWTAIGGGGVEGHVIAGRTFSRAYDAFVSLRAGWSAAAGSASDAMGGGPVWAHGVDAALGIGLRAGFGRIVGTLALDGAVSSWWLHAPGAAPVSRISFALQPGAALGWTFE